MSQTFCVHLLVLGSVFDACTIIRMAHATSMATLAIEVR